MNYFLSIACVAVTAIYWVPAYAQSPAPAEAPAAAGAVKPTIDKLKSEDVDKLLDKLAAQLDNIEIVDKPGPTRAKAQNLVNSVLRLVVQQQDTILEVEQANLSSALLKSLPSATSWPISLIEAFKTQANEFDMLINKGDPPGAFIRSADKTAEFANALDLTSAAGINIAPVMKAGRAVRTAVINKFAPPPVDIPEKTSVTAAATTLKKSLEKKGMFDILSSDPEVRTQLTELRMALAEYELLTQPRVHVWGALYGDISSIFDAMGRGKTITNKLSRVCVATATAVKFCQRKAECIVDLSTFAEDVCGFDPAPFLDSKYKALQIWYTCASNNKSTPWLDHPGIDTQELKPDAVRHYQSAFLYNKNQAFSCQDLQ